MIDLLTGVAVAVDDQAIAVFGDAFLFGDLAAAVIMRPSAASCSTVTSLTVGISTLGTISTWVGA